MEDPRLERIARNEASFRDINERLNTSLRQLPDNPAHMEFICECGIQTCDRHVQLSLDEYEEIRRDSRRFVVVPGHAILDAERIVRSTDRYDVVEKTGEAGALTDAADRRTAGEQGLRDEPPRD